MKVGDVFPLGPPRSGTGGQGVCRTCRSCLSCVCGKVATPCFYQGSGAKDKGRSPPGRREHLAPGGKTWQVWLVEAIVMAFILYFGALTSWGLAAPPRES